MSLTRLVRWIVFGEERIHTLSMSGAVRNTERTLPFGVS